MPLSAMRNLSALFALVLALSRGVSAATTMQDVKAFTSSAMVQVTPAITSGSSYAVGMEVGLLETFPNVLRNPTTTGVLESIHVTVKSFQTGQFDVCVFSTSPTHTTWTDHAATPGLNSADWLGFIGCYNVGQNNNDVGGTSYKYDGIGAVIDVAATSLYGVLVVTGSVPMTFSSTSDITVTIGTLQD